MAPPLSGRYKLQYCFSGSGGGGGGSGGAVRSAHADPELWAAAHRPASHNHVRAVTTPPPTPTPTPFATPPTLGRCAPHAVKRGFRLPFAGFRHFSFGARCGAIAMEHPDMADELCASMCCTACAEVPRCAAWTFDEQAICYLLDKPPHYDEVGAPNSEAFSGVMRVRAGAPLASRATTVAPLRARASPR